MALSGARLFALLCAGAVVGLLASPLLGQEAEEEAPRARQKARTRVPIRQVRGEGDDREAREPDERAGEADQNTEQSTERRQPKLQRGNVAPMRLPAIGADMLKVLTDWELHSAKITTLYGRVNRTTYDWTFLTQKHAEGTFAYRSPDQGIFKMAGLPVPPEGAKGRVRKNPATKKDVQFQLAEDKQEHWICTGTELLNIDHQTKTLEKLIIPPQNRGQGIMDTPLPFLFGMKVQQARARYQMEFLKKIDEDPEKIWLSAKPLWASDAANYKEAKIILMKDTFLPKAVQLTNPGGTAETVYQFDNLRTKLGTFERDPFKEKVPPYRQVQNARGDNKPNAGAAARRPENPRR